MAVTELMDRVERAAELFTDGHLILVRLGTHWNGRLGTVDEGSAEFQAQATLKELLVGMLLDFTPSQMDWMAEQSGGSDS